MDRTFFRFIQQETDGSVGLEALRHNAGHFLFAKTQDHNQSETGSTGHGNYQSETVGTGP